MENWKQIFNFSNYEVSDLGRVRSKPRPKTKGGIVKQHCCGDGVRLMVVIYDDNNKMTSLMVHRIVGTHFLPNFFGKTEIDHANRNQQDNRVVNLRWCSSTENKMNTKLRKDNKSGVKGVMYDKTRNKWVGLIRVNGKAVRKRFNTKEEAIKFREDLVKEHYNRDFYIPS